MSVALVPVCSPAGKRVSPSNASEALLDQRLLVDSTAYRSSERFGWPEWFKHAGIASVPSTLREQRFGNGLLALEAAITGQGLLLACPRVVQAELDSGKLIVAADMEMPCPFAYFMVCQPAALERPIVQEFWDWLLEEAGAATGRPEQRRNEPGTSSVEATLPTNPNHPQLTATP